MLFSLPIPFYNWHARHHLPHARIKCLNGSLAGFAGLLLPPPPLLQVRSTTLDVKVWEPSVVGLFQQLGNEFANQVWEGAAAGGAGGGSGRVALAGSSSSGRGGAAVGAAALAGAEQVMGRQLLQSKAALCWQRHSCAVCFTVI